MSENRFTPGPWMVHDSKGCRWIETHSDDVVAQVFKDDCSRETFDANARLIAAAPDLLEACINARDILATDRRSFVECQQLRDSRTDDPIAHGLVAVEDGVWLDSDDAEALRDYDHALEQIDSAVAKATGGAA